MFEDIPNWAWVLIVAQGITLYWIDRIGKATDLNYKRIMHVLRTGSIEGIGKIMMEQEK